MNFTKLSPNIFYSDINDGLKLFVDCLEFKIGYDDLKGNEQFCVIEKDGLGMHLIQNKEFAEKDRPEIRLETNNIQEVFEHVTKTFPELLHPNSNEISIKVLIDNSEESIRNGFGEVAGIEKLIKNKIEIFQSDGNLISFIISDDIGYFLFPQSKIFLEKAKGTNAFKLDPVTIQLLVQNFGVVRIKPNASSARAALNLTETAAARLQHLVCGAIAFL